MYEELKKEFGDERKNALDELVKIVESNSEEYLMANEKIYKLLKDIGPEIYKNIHIFIHDDEKRKAIRNIGGLIYAYNINKTPESQNVEENEQNKSEVRKLYIYLIHAKLENKNELQDVPSFFNFECIGGYKIITLKKKGNGRNAKKVPDKEHMGYVFCCGPTNKYGLNVENDFNKILRMCGQPGFNNSDIANIAEFCDVMELMFENEYSLDTFTHIWNNKITQPVDIRQFELNCSNLNILTCPYEDNCLEWNKKDVKLSNLQLKPIHTITTNHFSAFSFPTSCNETETETVNDDDDEEENDSEKTDIFQNKLSQAGKILLDYV